MHDLSIAVFSYDGHRHLLPYCLKSVQLHAPQHREIILVWDDGVTLRPTPINFDQLRDDVGVNFRVILHSEISSWPASIGRNGWIKQQLAKLMCVNYSHSEFTWIVDSDVLVTGDPELFSGNSPVLRVNHWHPVPESYQFFMHRYLGILDTNPNTFVGSTCLFEHRICNKLKSRCIEHCGMDLIQAVDHMLLNDPYPDLPFSEFEYYGHMARHEKNHVILPLNWNNSAQGSMWSQPLQIMWDHKQRIENLGQVFDRLMQHRTPYSRYFV